MTISTGIMIDEENCWDGTQLEQKTAAGSLTKNSSPWHLLPVNFCRVLLI